MAVKSHYKPGVVLRLLDDGFGYLRSEGSDEQFVFSFGTIQGYRGQTAKELHLKPGAKVRFSLQGEKVTEILLNGTNAS